jgi:O-antigen/teichoic acid export membrane protein
MVNKFLSKLRKDKHFSELIRGSFISFVLRIAGIGLGYVFVLIVTQGYGTKALGYFTLAFTVLQIASVLGRVGMDTLILRMTGEYISQDNGRIIILDIYRKIIFITLPASIIISIGLYFSSHLISVGIFHKPILSNFLQMASFGVVPMVMLFVHREGLRGLKKILLYSFFSGISISLFASIIIVALIYLSKNNMMPLYAQLLALMLSMLLAIFYWYKFMYTKEKKDKKEVSHKLLSTKKILSISLPMMLASSLFLVMNWTDTLILGMYKSAEEVGIYSVALKVSMLTSIVLMAINSISAPKFSEFFGKKDMIGLEKIVKQSTQMIFLLTLPLLIILLAFPSFILGIFGSDFEIGSTVLMILVIGQFFNAISGSVGTLLSMTGYQVIVQNILIVSIFINIVLNLLLVTNYGMVGVAIATMTSTIVWNGLMNYYIWKKLGFTTFSIGLNK